MVAVFSALCAVGIEKNDIARIDESTSRTTLLGIICDQQNVIRELQAGNAAYVQLDRDVRDFVTAVVVGIRNIVDRQPLQSAKDLLSGIADDLEQNLPTP
jgi:hypothetical protein